MTRLRNLDVLLNAGAFDARWYAEAYPDAAAQGLSSEEHFARIGHGLGRGLGPSRPAPDPDLARALARRPVVSYCVALMNRGEDLRATLRTNLEENRPLADSLEFVVVFLDEDRATQDWVRREFAPDLATGFLRLIVEPPLDLWHFGRAKNRHRRYILGEVFSSLDGDNLVTREETEQLLEAHRRFPEGFLFHHFSGTWGDGTSGRVSLPARLYEAVGYDERLLPRQFDEMDLIVTTLARHPELPFLRTADNAVGLRSARIDQFLRSGGRHPAEVVLPAPRRIAALNPKSPSYVSRDDGLRAMQDFNQALCFAKNATDPAVRDRYAAEALTARQRVIDALARDRLVPILFEPEPARAVPPLDPAEVCAVLCVKDEGAVLQAFLRHHRALGVARFLVVDDGSAPPLDAAELGPDVHVFRPRVGDFRTAKGLWLGGLIKAFVPEGAWVLTADADEFLDLPPAEASLPDLLARLPADREWLPGLLLDMLPRPGLAPEALARADSDFEDVLDHVAAVEAPVPDDYAQNPSVRWGFGPWARLSWRVDARYHAFGTVDSLRKIPLFRARPGRHLNQGFHTLHTTDGSAQPGWEVWATDRILPIRHYKLRKLFSDGARDRMVRAVEAAGASPYHARTTGNIARIFGEGGGAQALLFLPSRPRSEAFAILRALRLNEPETAA
jgi:hypothetical protein